MSCGSETALTGLKRSVHMEDHSSLDGYRLGTENVFHIGGSKWEIQSRRKRERNDEGRKKDIYVGG